MTSLFLFYNMDAQEVLRLSTSPGFTIPCNDGDYGATPLPQYPFFFPDPFLMRQHFGLVCLFICLFEKLLELELDGLSCTLLPGCRKPAE